MIDIELLQSKEHLFWRNITIVSDFSEDCWLWHGSTNNGYGAILLKTTAEGKLIRIYAHRFSYILFVSPIPDDVLCLHFCDESRCCNPSHLFLGTHKDNVQDMWQKGRGPDRKKLRHTEESKQKISEGMKKAWLR